MRIVHISTLIMLRCSQSQRHLVECRDDTGFWLVFYQNYRENREEAENAKTSFVLLRDILSFLMEPHSQLQSLQIIRFYYFCNFMGKQAKKQAKKGFPLLTTAQSNAYKEQVGKQGKTLLSGSDIQMEKLMQTNPDQNYMAIFKKDYDSLKETHRLDELQDSQYKYNQKAKRDRHFDKRYQAETKTAYNAPLTANQQYGWREPIDTLQNYCGMKHTFDEKLAVTIRNKDKQKK